ncbi:hypothetical protein [Hymenobacter rigui]|uniref:Uncharacterized protein n=1 Tax=Hymenobacter rigui TaxID=334424 RepID=A0A428KG22_9BACT|nr:hypothetical protein [Hymenobacter rigui]RSK45255.1 hypothetical protein EI291_19275 [Hymenobacter rigui]
MKKVFACLVFVSMAIAGTSVQASPGDGSKVAARATDMTRRIAERTKLTEGQYVKVRALNVRLLTEMADLRKQFANDAVEMDKAMAEVQMRYEWDLAAVLGPKRMMAYEEMKTNFTAVNMR